ncbi:MAG: hypothetical protein J0H68_01765 [Sphingobacteriia bacterium]|nr:hypothetical protein [Sphingobacteriia bacterium]
MLDSLLQQIKDNTLTNLHLVNKNVSTEEITLLCEALKSNTSVKSLNILYIKIKDTDLQTIIEMLKVNKTIQMLTLTDTGITSKYIPDLAKVLETHPQITYLSINGLEIESSESLQLAFTNLIKSNTNLTHISMTSLDFSGEQGKYLAKAIDSHVFLLNFDHKYL